MNRLRAYRAIEGISQVELANRLGISPQLVSAIESGRRAFTGDLSVLGYSTDRLATPDMSEPLHRRRASTLVASRKRAKELLRLAGEVFAELRKDTANVPEVRLTALPAPETLDEIEEAAAEVRFLFDLETDGPIKNLTTAAERAGICLVPMVGLPGIDGLSSWVEGIPVIGLDPNVPGDRFRLTLAHEIGHLVMHKKPGANAEREANWFASTMLINSDDFEDAMPERLNLRDLVGLKSSWGISVAALVYRAHEVGVIDDQRYRALQIQMSKWRKKEPAPFEPAHGKLFPRLVEVNGGYPNIDDLGFNVDHVKSIVDWRHLRVA